MQKPNEHIEWQDYMSSRLKKNPDEATGYLRASLEEYEKNGDVEFLLIAVQRVARMKKEMAIEWQDYMVHRLKKNPDEAIRYLRASLEEYEKNGEIEALLIAVQRVAATTFKFERR